MGVTERNEAATPAASEAGRPAVASLGIAFAALVTAVALTAAAGVLLITGRYGTGVTPDSVTYLAAAESLRTGDGMRGVDGEPMAVFPPLYPALIAVVSAGPPGPVGAARALNAVSLAVTVCVSGWLAWRLTGVGGYGFAAAAAVALSQPVLDSALHMWSETAFTAVSMASLALAVVSIGRRADGRLVVGAAVLAGLAALTRYIGVTLAPVAGGLALVGRPRGRRGMLRACGLIVVALAPVAFWVARNLIVTGTPTGERYPSDDPLPDTIYDTLLAVARWAVPFPVGDRARLGALVLGGALLCVGAARAGRDRASDLPPAGLGGVTTVAAYCGLYVVYLVVASSVTALDPIDQRLIAPVAPPLAVLAIAALQMGVACLCSALRRWGSIGLPVVVAAWLIGLGWQSWRMVERIDARGIGGYEAARWRDSALLAYVTKLPADGVIYSNDPFAVRFYTGREARLSPRAHPYRSPRSRVDDLLALGATLEDGRDVYLAWFDGVPRDFIASPDELAATIVLEEFVRASDGVIYRVVVPRPASSTGGSR